MTVHASSNRSAISDEENEEERDEKDEDEDDQKEEEEKKKEKIKKKMKKNAEEKKYLTPETLNTTKFSISIQINGVGLFNICECNKTFPN